MFARYSAARALYGLATLILASMAANAIMPLMVLITEPLKHDLLLTDSEIGALRGLGASLVTALASYPVAALADRYDRRAVYAICVFIWCASTGLAGVAGHYPTLFACSMGSAIGEAAVGPITFALIPELFPGERRQLANSTFFMAQLLGLAVGMAVNGVLLGTIDSWHASLPASLRALPTWRIALFANSLSCVILVPMILLLPSRRPAPAASRGDSGVPVSTLALGAYLREHAPTLLPIFIGFGALGAANFTIFGWMPVAIQREFRLSSAEVGIRFGQVYACASIAGVIMATVLARRLGRTRGEAASLRIASTGAGAALLLIVFYFLADDAFHLYLVTGLQIAALTAGLTLAPTISQNLAPAAIRARLLAIGGIFFIAFAGLCPLAVGVLSDVIAGHPHALLTAMTLVELVAFVPGILLLRGSGRTLALTLRAARIADEAAAASSGSQLGGADAGSSTTCTSTRMSHTG
jgi:MFS family permease